MRESDKDPKVAAELEGLFGRSTAISTDRCVSPPFGCGRQITQKEFQEWEGPVLREYSISGLCSTCQARAFAPPVEFFEDKGCNGQCVTASDVGVFVQGDPIAYPHPDCPEHGKLHKGENRS